jgi:hypothetical protein
MQSTTPETSRGMIYNTIANKLTKRTDYGIGKYQTMPAMEQKQEKQIDKQPRNRLINGERVDKKMR